MGKRSNFERVERDFYPTPLEAVVPLVGNVTPIAGKEKVHYYEPCVGDGALCNHLLSSGGFLCRGSSDIAPLDGSPAKDALLLTALDVLEADYIITNPPWNRNILHPMIEHFSDMRPTWLLFDADWMHTKQSAPYMRRCKKIVSVGRVKWIPDSKMTGKDNCAWYLFDKNHEGATEFVGREE